MKTHKALFLLTGFALYATASFYLIPEHVAVIRNIASETVSLESKIEGMKQEFATLQTSATSISEEVEAASGKLSELRPLRDDKISELSTKYDDFHKRFIELSKEIQSTEEIRPEDDEAFNKLLAEVSRDFIQNVEDLAKKKIRLALEEDSLKAKEEIAELRTMMCEQKDLLTSLHNDLEILISAPATLAWDMMMPGLMNFSLPQLSLPQMLMPQPPNLMPWTAMLPMLFSQMGQNKQAMTYAPQFHYYGNAPQAQQQQVAQVQTSSLLPGNLVSPVFDPSNTTVPSFVPGIQPGRRGAIDDGGISLN
jgi:hypothetical protein